MFSFASWHAITSQRVADDLSVYNPLSALKISVYTILPDEEAMAMNKAKIFSFIQNKKSKMVPFLSMELKR